MDNLYLKGEMLQIHTKNYEVVEGQFYEMTNDKSRISLCNVKELPLDNPSDGILHYYDSEIQNIVKLKLSNDQNQTSLKLSEKEYEGVIKMSKTYKYINQVDQAFHDALKDLNEYSYVGLSTDGAEKGRKVRMPFLVMSTPHQVYIFDTHVMQYSAFDAGLKKFLEAQSPKKIVHDSRLLSDCLYHKHNVKLAAVFDTQVGDLIITRNKNGVLPKKVKSLNECLSAYIGLQRDIVEEKLDIVQCTERPLPTNIKETLAKNIAFIHLLSEEINEGMKLPFKRGVDCYIENIRSSDDFKAWELSGKQNLIPKDFKSAIEY